MTSNQKNQELQHRLATHGIYMLAEEAAALRRAQMTLHRWAELECGDGDDYKSWMIERDEEEGPHGTPVMAIYPHNGPKRTYRIPDRETGALKRVAALCKRLGLYFYHQTDPRGCALYVSNEPLPNNDYTRGVPCAV